MPVETTILSCPVCSRVSQLPSSGINLWLCSCGTVIYRENEVLKTNTVLALRDSESVFQPGVRGEWHKRKFQLTGRIRIWSAETVLNYWTVLFEDGELWFLEEGYGLYTFLEPEPETFITGEQLKKISYDSKPVTKKEANYILTSVSESNKVEVEGFVSIPADCNLFTVYDFASDNGTHVFITHWSNQVLKEYAGYPVSFDELQLTGLREQTKQDFSFQCKNCPEQIVINSFPQSQSCACKRCGTGYKYNTGSGFVKAFKQKDHYTPQFQLGTTGFLDGVEWKVIGCVQKEESNSYKARWREYTLFNRFYGYAFLSEFNNHWIFLKERADAPVLKNEKIHDFTYEYESFTIFNEYKYEIVSAYGEFPYNVFNSEDVKAKEFISPPEIWIREKSSSEGIRWYFGHHVRPSVIKRAFRPDVPFGFRKGIGAVQPTGYKNPLKLAVITLVAVLLLLLIHGVYSFTQQKKVLYHGVLLFSDSINTATYFSQPFILDKYSGNLELLIDADVSNSWAELNASLVNTKTGKEYSVEKGVEYYFGYTDGESWTEGSTRSEVYITGIPAGTYQLQLIASKEPSQSLQSMNVTAVYDAESPRNVAIPIIIIVLFAGGSFLITQVFERERWRDSPFSTYTYEE